jgi:hypothetical protein
VASPGERASDDDRQRVVADLQRHTVAGRLSLDEFTSRVDQVLRATTHGDLTRITGDLPRPVPTRRDHWYLLVAMVLSVATIAVLALSLKFW